MKTRQTLTRIVAFFVITGVLTLLSCAKIGSVEGGDKDTIPPSLIKSTPLNFSTHFNSKKLNLVFSEYIDLKDITKEFFVSPPLAIMPEVKIHNKSIQVEPLDSLAPNTTYTLDFGFAIVDLTESNPIPNFEYVLSTGDYIDSLSVSGRLLDAFDQTPPKDPFLLMLYENLSDSAPLLEKPMYLSRTDKLGFFSINNLRSDTFRLFALKDVNNNMRFDVSTEQIAFVDTTFILSAELFHKVLGNDTLKTVKTDTIIAPVSPHPKAPPGKKKESVVINTDSIARIKKMHSTLFVDVFSFVEKNEKQYLTVHQRLLPMLLRLAMSLPLEDTIGLIPLNDTIHWPWYIKEPNPTNDTIDYWITDTSLISKSPLTLLVSYPATDSLGSISRKTDTLEFRYTAPEHKKNKKQEMPKPPKQVISLNFTKGKIMDLNSVVRFVASRPVSLADPSQILFTRLIDTIEVPVLFKLHADSLNLRKFNITNTWLDNTAYHIQVFPHAFPDIYGTLHDTLDMRFKTQRMEYYGRLIVTLENQKQPVIMQILKDDKLQNESYVQSGGKVVFDYMYPGKYKVKLIYDTNGNHQWDTGKYLRNQQPEKVWFYSKEIEIRSNWDMEISVPGSPPD